MSRIVIIEDNPDSARLATRILERAGHEVIAADDGEMGVTAVFASLPDAVLIDLGLPDMDGQTVIGLLKQQPHLQHIALIIFTAYPQASAAEMARAYGCHGVIFKPIETRAFAGQVDSIIRSAHTPTTAPEI